MYLARITTEKTLCYSKAFAFVVKEFAALVGNFHVEAEIPFTNVSQVTYGQDENGTVIAASVHAYDASKRAFWIQFSAVEQAHRERGAYRELVAEICQLAKAVGAVNIYSGVSSINDDMLEVVEKLGRRPVVVRFKIPLTE